MVDRTRAAALSNRGSPRTRIAEAGTPRLTSRAASASAIAAAAATLAYPGASSCRAGHRSRPLPADTVPATMATVTPPIGGTRRQLGPEVEFRENEKIGAQRFEQRADIARQIIGQVSRRVHGKTSRQRLCGRAEVRIDELANGTDSAQCVDDALCLEALADRGGVEPDEWSRRVSMETRPFVEPGCRVAARAIAGAEFG